MEKKHLIVEVRQGLANRLCALAAGRRLAELYGREFLLVWPPEPDCPCTFDELFEPCVRCWASVDDCLDELGAITTADTAEHFVHGLVDCLRGLELSNVESRVVVLRTPFFCHDRVDTSTPSAFAHLDCDVLRGPFQEDRIVRAFDAVLDGLRGPLRRFLLDLAPQARIVEEVDAFSRLYFRGPVHGVHVRGTDSWRCLRARGLLLETIRRLATGPDRMTVFVAGDDRAVLEHAITLGQGRVVTRANAHDPGRFRQTSIQDALIDLLLLARTQHLHKPPFSSFALVSAAIGEVPMTVVRTAWPSQLLDWGARVGVAMLRTAVGGARRLARTVGGGPRASVPELGDAFLADVVGVIHVGAHLGEERDVYDRHDLNVLWIEPSPELFASLQKNIADRPKQKAARCLVIDEDGRECEFHISSNRGMSSSILPLKLHAAIWPHVAFVKTILLKGRTLPSLLRAERIDVMLYDALVLDTQGTELLVLKSAADMLRHFKYIKTEAADVEMYEGCCTLADIVAFLKPLGFVEIERSMFSPRPEIGGCYDVLFRRAD